MEKKTTVNYDMGSKGSDTIKRLDCKGIFRVSASYVEEYLKAWGHAFKAQVLCEHMRATAHYCETKALLDLEV